MPLVKAVQLVAHGKPGRFQIRDLPELSPGPKQVVVQVHACGLNRLDLWLEEAALPIPLQLPRTPGCEIAGQILSIGPNVNHWRPGDRVAVPSNLFCGQCEFCRRGDESMCVNSIILGVQCDGGFAEQVLAPAHVLSRLPENVGFETAAALTLAGSTAMHMLTNRAAVAQGDWVLVIGGASGVGSAAIQIARQLGARVLSTGSSEEKRALCLRLGAEVVVDSTEPQWPARIRQITGKRGVDWAIEHVGGEVLQAVFQCLARGGAVVTCGATAGWDIPLNLWPFFVKQHRLIGSYSRNCADLEQTLAWAAEGRLKPVVDRTYPLPQTPAAFAQLRERKVCGKLLVLP